MHEPKRRSLMPALRAFTTAANGRVSASRPSAWPARLAARSSGAPRCGEPRQKTWRTGSTQRRAALSPEWGGAEAEDVAHGLDPAAAVLLPVVAGTPGDETAHRVSDEHDLGHVDR